MSSRKGSQISLNPGKLVHALVPYRSDGILLDETQINDSYSLVEPGDSGLIFWLNHLGNMLRNELMSGVPGDSRVFSLECFPDNYRLWVYVDVNKRKNYYLYGYPIKGTKGAYRYFRSVITFFPHLLWLLGPSENRSDCACEFCNTPPGGGSRGTTGTNSLKEKPQVSVAVSPAPAPSPVPTVQPPLSSAPRPAVSSGAHVAQATVVPAASTPKTAKATSKPTAGPVSRELPVKQTTSTFAPAAPTQKKAIVPSKPTTGLINQGPPAKHIAAAPSGTQVDDESDTIFRCGEVVWYQYNRAWRLGITLGAERQVPWDASDSQPSQSTYIIIPFTYDGWPLDKVVKAEPEMRPFLTFSVPAISPPLESVIGQPLSTINWAEIQLSLTSGSTQKEELLILEASKLASIIVDHSYSTYGALPTKQGSLRTFSGLFFGSERIMLNEAVRLRGGAPDLHTPNRPRQLLVLVVSSIQYNEDSGALSFTGDVWRLDHTSAQNPPPSFPQNLPAAMRRERDFRNGVVSSSQHGHGHGGRQQQQVDWYPVELGATKAASQVRGRFYETQRLGPILRPGDFAAKLSEGQVVDIQEMLNNRGDSKGPDLGRRRNRLETVRGAIPDQDPASFIPGVDEDTGA
ncbi:hypothetical protein GGR56DRAFT_630660 [Xylariaceae sp. FL0804]|nr:hypothetical protein GGR56DRAFT_630660 [Xylariaceae sp. FL0804]